MKNKDKAKCPYFDSLFGYPKRYGITCWMPEENNCKVLNFPITEKGERNTHFENVCCGRTFYMCRNYPVKYPNGWLNPDGEFFQTPFCQHSPAAMLIEGNLKLKPQLNDYGSIVHGEELLEVLGWIKLYAEPSGKDGHIFMNGKIGREMITVKQIQYLESIRSKMIGSQVKDYYYLIKRGEE